jgi:hypothetical protein
MTCQFWTSSKWHTAFAQGTAAAILQCAFHQGSLIQLTPETQKELAS